MIQWYPGHMAKARREISELLRLTDVVIEVLDARAPGASENPDISELIGKKPRVLVINKEDKADPVATKKWMDWYDKKGKRSISFCAMRKNSAKTLVRAIELAASPVVEKWAVKGVKKPIRVMIAGIPNVGKSSIINCLAGNTRAKSGPTPGVTRGRQWIRISERMELLDTPGILWPKFADQDAAMSLAALNSIRDEILDEWALANNLFDKIMKVSPKALEKRFEISFDSLSSEDGIAAISKRRGFLMRGGEYDLERAATLLIDEFRSGKIGRITLQMPETGEVDEATGD